MKDCGFRIADLPLTAYRLPLTKISRKSDTISCQFSSPRL